MSKLNCWEFMKCGRETGGNNAKELGVCPAAIEKESNGIHGGVNAGRCCWTIEGTLCHGKVQGIFTEKFALCSECAFYRLVSREEVRYLTAIEIKKINKMKLKTTPQSLLDKTL